MKGTAYRIPVCRIQLVRERMLQVKVRVIRSPSDAAAILSEYLAGMDREHFVVMCLNTRLRVVNINTAAIGTLAEVSVHPREVFKAAVLSNAAAIIVGHNHPSGNPEPSQNDLAVTDRLVASGEILGIPVLDHIVVAESGFTSLHERGLVPTAVQHEDVTSVAEMVYAEILNARSPVRRAVPDVATSARAVRGHPQARARALAQRDARRAA